MPRTRNTLLNMLLGFYNPRIPIRQPQFIRRPVYIQPKPQPKPEPKLPIQCDVIQPLNELKAVFLLELSSGTHVSTDVNIKKTLEYYWDNHPNEFSRCPIEDTKGDINVLLSLLDKYYAKGYRNFSGFTSSNVVKNVIPWFNEHPCARGITSLGSLTALEKIPKNIFRLTPNILSRIETIFPNITSKKIYFIYTKGFLVNDEITNELQEFKKQGIINDIIVYEEDEITLSGVTNFFKNSTENDVLITNLTNNLEDFLDIISTASVSIGSIYEIGAIRTPVIKPQNSSFLENKYYFLELVGVCTSILLRNAKKSLGNDFKNTVINQLNMLHEFKKSDSFENCNSHVGITDFDSASKYLLYSNILINKLSSENKFISEKMYINDPYVGKYFANFISEQTVLQSNILMNPRNISGKVIALLEINNPNLNFDTILNYGILYYWNYDKTLPRFPIINIYTNGVNDNELINNTIVLLDKYYRDGYRIFFGFSRSTILKGVNDWFAKHSDAVALSCFSTSIDRELIDRTNTNVYRLEYSDDYIVDSILPLINTNEKIFYLYSGNENAAINIKDYITKNITSELLFYNIDIPGNYTASSINNFFRDNDVSDNSVVILYIFNESNYYDLYESPDLIHYPKIQYSILNELTPIIKGVAREKLNGLNYILTASPNSSKIWRDNASYLTNKFKADTNSASLLDAIKMIQYLQDGKPTNLLGSHNGTLQFNDKGDRMFPSYLNITYKKETDTFVNNSILFDDPLLGKFQADLTNV